MTRGRRTGRDRAVRLWFAHEDGVLWVRADERGRDWLRNLRKDPSCIVRVGRHEVPARYEHVADRDTALRTLVGLWRAKYGPDWVQDWYIEHGREPVRLLIDSSSARSQLP